MKYVISLGGSLIVPDEIDSSYLKKFVNFIKILSRRNKIIVVTGGGSTARKYLVSLKNSSDKAVSAVGIEATRLNAVLVSGFFGLETEIPVTLTSVKKFITKNNLVVCGALGRKPEMTTDANAAEIAHYMNAEYFANLTDVKGLYDKDPDKYKSAELIQEISYNDFNIKVNKLDFKAGQHFVLDQTAARIIAKHKIKTAILDGRNFKNLNDFFKGKKFTGTLIK